MTSGPVRKEPNKGKKLHVSKKKTNTESLV